MGKKRVLIGCPVFNEEQGITDFLAKIDAIAHEHPSPVDWSLLIVDDGSTDQSVAKIRAFPFRGFSDVKVISLSRNYGHTAAIAAIVDHAREDALVLLDADEQDEPNLIPKLVAEWLRGSFAVRVRRGRRHEGRVFHRLSVGFYWIFEKITDLQSYMGIFGLYDRRVYEALRQFPEVVRYHPGLISLVGYKTHTLTAERKRRKSGKTRVGLIGLIQLANNAIFSFSTVPVLVVTILGILISLTAFIGALIVVLIRIFTTEAIPGWASLLSGLLFMTGLVIFSLGIVGQYIAVIVQEVKRRPKYVVDQEHRIGTG